MRKRVTLWALMLCMLLTGCGGASGQDYEISQPMPGFDAQNKYFLTVGADNFQEADDFFFGTGIMGDYVYYHDKASGIFDVLCTDPACSHPFVECSAYINSGASLSWYDGALYWVARSPDKTDVDAYLWRNDLLGGGREKVKRISFEDVILVYQPQHYMIHRGVLYILGRANAVEGAGAGYRITLLSSPLDSSEEFTVLYDETFSWSARPTVRFVGNSIYFSLASYPEDGSWDLTVTRFDIATGDSEVIYEETGITERAGAIWVTEQGEIYLPLERDNYGGSVWKLEDGKRLEVISWEGDHSYIWLMDGIATNTTSEYLEDGSRIRYVDIKNYAGETIYSGPWFPEGIPGIEGNPSEFSFAVVGGDAEKIILSLEDHTSEGYPSYTVLVDLRDTMKPTVLWSSKE